MLLIVWMLACLDFWPLRCFSAAWKLDAVWFGLVWFDAPSCFHTFVPAMLLAPQQLVASWTIGCLGLVLALMLPLKLFACFDTFRFNHANCSDVCLLWSSLVAWIIGCSVASTHSLGCFYSL